MKVRACGHVSAADRFIQRITRIMMLAKFMTNDYGRQAQIGPVRSK